MKRYIKSDYSPEMWNRVRSQNPNGYLYIFKHGVGPGTIPYDVEVIKYKDLPNYYTAVWLDRFLTTSELREYDIPSETRINTILDRIGYCQKNGDVVPCDVIKASDEIEDTWSIEDETPYGFDKSNCANWGTDEWAFYIASQLDFPEDDYYAIFDDLENLRGDEWLADAEEATQDDPEMFECFKRFVNLDEEDVEACDNITASEICYRDRDNDDRIVALDVGMSDDEVAEMLAAHPSYYRSTLEIEGCDNITSSTYDYTQLALPDYKYSVEGYYDSNFQGLVDSYTGDDFSEALEAAHNFVCDGDFIIIKNEQTGRTRSYSTDDWFNAIDMGEYPADVYSIQ